MLALFFSIGPELYAIPARRVVEVVPRVSLRPLPCSPPWLPGVFAYRGAVIGVVDLSQRMHGLACPSRLSSRIVVVERAVGRDTLRYGLLTERVSEVRQLTAQPEAAELRESPLIQGTVLHDGKLIQWLDLDAVLPESSELLTPTEN